jgi:hypothetical protein
MPQKTNLNVNPYYEDFDASKNFYKILFRPGYSIQGRELTQVQSILQNQIESFGKYAFKQGEQVIPGEVGLNTKLDYVKLSSVSEVAISEGDDIVYKKYDITQLVGQQLRGLTSGVLGTVLSTRNATETNADTLFVSYLNSGNSNTEPTFRQGETLEVVDGVNTPLLVVGTDGSVLPTSISVTNPDTGEVTSLDSPAMGYGSAVKVEEGIYFVNGYFVRNDEQLLVIEEYYDKPSAKVGFTIKEAIATPETDASLYDNAIGSSNYTAPGAHRLQISLEMKEFALDAITDKNFIQLLTVKRGVVQRKITTTDFSVLEQTLARRTYDESGDYVVTNFDINMREWAQKDGNRGIYAADEFGLYNGYDQGVAARKMIASIGPGKAYVRGYEIVNKEIKYLEINKARESLTSENVTVKSKRLPTLNVTNVYGSVPLNKEGAELTAYPDVFLYGSFNDASIGVNGTEATTEHRQTIVRRGLNLTADDGIKTLTLKVNGLNGQPNLADITDANFESKYGTLYYIRSYSAEGTATDVGTLTAVSFATINRPSIDTNESTQFLEITVVGKKNELDQLLIEYDDGIADKIRKLYISRTDAESTSAVTSYWAEVKDYRNTFTPLIGKVKPNNFFLKKRGAGFNSDSDVILSKGRLAGGTSVYNSIFGLSYFDPQFFTKIILETAPTGYDEGKYVFGLESGAYGVVEGTASGVYSAGRILFVKTLSGNFLPGESIRDEDDNTVRIAKNNTISHFIVNNRGAGYATGAGVQINGVTYDSSKILAETTGGSVYKVGIVNASFVRNLEYTQPPEVIITGSGSAGGAASVRAVLVRDAVTTYRPQNVKSIGSSYGSGGANKFSADVVVDNQSYADLTDVTSFTFFGRKGTTFVESTSFSADAAGFLQQGDLIQFSDEDNNIIRTTVEYATQAEGVDKTRIYLDQALPGNVVNTSIVRLRPKAENTNGGTLLYPTGSKQVVQISAGGDDTKIKYYFRRDFVTTAASGDGLITFAAQLPFGTQRFAAYTEENYIITVLDPGDAPNIAKGDIVYIPADSVSISSATDTASGLTSGSINLNVPEGYFGTVPSNGTFPKLKLTATLEVSNAKPRLKTAVRNKRIVVTASGDRVIPLRGNDYDSDVIELISYSDVFKLRYVYEGTPSQPPEVDTAGNLVSGIDVTDRYTFDDGQRDTLYDVSRLVLKPGFESSTGQLVIAFDFFVHSQGDFCTIDSYLHEAGVGEDEIPGFNSPVLGNLELKNVIDFRPKVDNNAIIPGYLDKSLLEVTEGSFSGSGAVIASSPASDNGLEYTFSFSQKEYLDRIDGVFLNKKGEFIVKEGNSSLNPVKPEPIDDAIALFYAYIPAYTRTSKDVRITPVDNRRYTMRDIGKLEKRIERLEYYTTLSILEQQALNMQVRDSVGMDRFKSGFFVDNFEAHSVGNLTSLDYRCAIDPQQSVLRPQSREDSIDLVEVNVREDQRSVAGYKKSGHMVTLPYTPLSLLGNSAASKKINPNPFVVVQYVGDGELSPSIDQWYDQHEEPLVVDTNTNLYTIFLAKDNTKESFSSIHNSFIINWVGAAPAFASINSLGEVNTQQAIATVTSASVASSSNISPQNNDVGKGVQTKTVRGNVVSNSLSFFARSLPIKYVIRRMKPNTKMYVFLEGRNIDRWVNPDLRFTGIAGNSLSAFNGGITTDEYGNASGLIILPGGYAPTENAVWNGDVDTLSYDTSSEQINVSTGDLTFRFTSSATNESKNDASVNYTEVKYYATGILPENPSSIVSTKPSTFKSNEGVQTVESNTDNPIRPNPLAQMFKVENQEGGCFVTGVDLFFNKKDPYIPVKAYITDVDAEKPGKNIVPGSEKTLSPNTFLKCYTNGDVAVYKNENVTGVTSAASGPILQIFDKNNVELVATASGKYSLTNEQVYTIVLGNHNGKSFVQNEDLEIPSLTLANDTGGTNLKLTIAKDSGKLSGIRVTNPGLNYDSAILTIESPQLPGGSTATAAVEVSGGKIYNAEISLSGFGYTEAPSVVVKGIGNGAGGCEIQTIIDIDTPAVRMGVSIDVEGVTESTTPTHFAFDYPVYLQNDTEYALVVETDSTDYELWSSLLGETDISTSTVITTQASLGSLYKSQNTESWQEDNAEDLKFTLYRAEFDISRTANLLLKNDNLGYELLQENPFETNASAATNATSKLFKNNNKIVKANHRDHGFEDSGKSYVFYRTAQETGGVTADILNSTLFQISNSGVDTYNITSITNASSNSFGGGSVVYGTHNRKFETLYPLVGYLSFTGTKVESFIKTTNIVPVDSSTTNYVSYSQTDYEKTFLNEPQYFTNQKIVASEINETLNNLDQSLVYKIQLSSTASNLSPIFDLSNASVKTSTTRVENGAGKETRFGRQDQKIKFFPVYQFQLSGNGGTEIQTGQVIKGQTTKASGTIARVNGSVVYVRVKTQQFFQQGETVSLGDQAQLTSVIVDSNPAELFFDIADGATIVARNPSVILETYDNIITGKSVLWNSRSQELTLRTDIQPINDDFTGKILGNAAFARGADTANQTPDIFRVGDIVKYPTQEDTEASYLEVGSIEYTNGIDFVAEDTSKNSSSIAKYVTKEVGISNPGTSIDVRLTANVKDIANVKVLYRFKKASSQENFEDIDWEYFNTDGSPDVLEIATSENNISSVTEKQSSYQELKYSVSDLPEFASFAVKIVMMTVDPAYAPKVQDIRAVASF